MPSFIVWNRTLPIYSCQLEDDLWSSPGVLLGLDQTDDVLHPQHQVAHHAEEAELVSGVDQLHPATLRRLQQVLPGLQDLRGTRRQTVQNQQTSSQFHLVSFRRPSSLRFDLF